MHVLYNKQNMDDLAAEAVGLGRQVAERAKALHLGDTAKDVAFVSRCFARLKDRQPFDESDEGGFDAVMDILERCIASEFLGRDERYGPVPLSCRPKCSFKPPSVRKRRGFSNPMLSVGGAGYKSR
jgi:hypothetical protein